jgi:YVTN family beta-propeller protein
MGHVIDEAAGAVVENIIVGTRPRRFVLTPDGSELWVSAELSGEVYVIDRASTTVKDVITFLPPGFRQVDVTPVGMAITDDGATVIVTLGRANHIAFVDAASKEIEDYVLVGSRAWGVGLSPDEATLYVANGLSDDLTVVDAASRRVTKSVPVGRVPHSVLVDD